MKNVTVIVAPNISDEDFLSFSVANMREEDSKIPALKKTLANKIKFINKDSMPKASRDRYAVFSFTMPYPKSILRAIPPKSKTVLLVSNFFTFLRRKSVKVLQIQFPS